MRVFAERLEGYRIMDLASRFSRIMQCNQILGFQGLLCDRISIVMLSASDNQFCDNKDVWDTGAD